MEIAGALRGGATTRDIDEVLDVVGLFSRADDKVKTFSHGMKQRLGIAQALLGRPELIVLDEPTSGLDPQGIKEVRELIRRLSAERSMTIFLSSHLLGEIEQTATSMAIINRGTLIVQGNVKDLLADNDTLVDVEAAPEVQALEALRRQPYARDVKQEGGALRCVMSRDQIPELTRTLVGAGIDVRAIIPRRSLEEYFLSITEGASDVAPASRRNKE
jgi:ABC-2 type transport system ATP-binding protein